MDKPIREIGLYQTRDTVGQCTVGPIIASRSEGAAARIFTEGLKDQNVLGRHAEDYELVYIGIQDETTGKIVDSTEKPQIILTGKQWKMAQEKPREKRTDINFAQSDE